MGKENHGGLEDVNPDEAEAWFDSLMPDSAYSGREVEKGTEVVSRAVDSVFGLPPGAFAERLAQKRREEFLKGKTIPLSELPLDQEDF